MTKVIIILRGGVLQGVMSDTPLKYVLVDWDNIDAGDEFPEMEDFTYAYPCTNTVEEVLTTLRINNILKNTEDE